jgi:glycosyltransferase involved in cell wall biosynthesis
MQIIWFAEIKWDYLKTRKQQIIARKPAHVQVLYLEPYTRGRSNEFRIRKDGDIYRATVPFVKSAPVFPWRQVLDSRRARRVLDAFVSNRVRGMARQMGFDRDRVGFIISNIYAADIAASLPRKFLLYDCNDDHSAFPGMPAWSEQYFLKTCRSADSVFVSSKALRERVVAARGGDNRVAHLGNGVDFAHFLAKRRDEPPAKPRLGYVGALAPWLDFEAIRHLAERHPEWEVVLVGPVVQGAEGELAKLTTLANVSRLPAVPYERLPDVLGRLSVGLIPFRMNQLTRGVNPNKLYEYLAAGLPVVATPFSEEVTKYPDLVDAAPAGEEFSIACERVIGRLSNRQDAEGISERARQIARENDWNRIALTFWSKIDEMMNAA